jgi:nitroimidazol reductase NimA-like FMN-containing flavoprotein (pyridoxamine 5'-phosphate oxidase superfamily)
MLEQMKSLVCTNDTCVLATVGGHRPHCSLMAYTSDDTGEHIYLITLKNSLKYRNIIENPSVSLLIDTRGVDPRSETRALTVSGEVDPIADPEQARRVRAKLLARHPHLAELAALPQAALLCVTIREFLLLDGVLKAYRATL